MSEGKSDAKSHDRESRDPGDEATAGEPSFEREMRESMRRVFLAGLGALAVAEEEGSKLFRRMVEHGASYRERHRDDWEGFGRRVGDEASKVRERAGSTLGKLEKALEDAIAERLRRSGSPTGDDVAELARRIEELTRQVEALRARRGGAGR